MKLYIKSIIAFAALLLTTNAWADKQFTYFYQLDGAQSSADAAGTVVGNISGTTATLTVTPNEGNYFENTDGSITVHKTLNGQYAQAREKAPGYDTPVALTVSGTPDPTGETVFTFEVTDEKYDYEVTVNFKSKISIANASITLAQTSYTYTGEAIEPSITTVKLTDGTTLASTDYTVAFENNINVPATANDPQPTITVTGVGKYTGTASTTFTISKAAGTISYATASVNKTYGDAAFTNELTITGDGTVRYKSNNLDAATVDEQTGEVMIVGNGEATITATVTDGTNYTYATKTASYLVSVGTAAMEVKADGFTGTYDGQAHGITVNAPQGATITYSTDGNTYNPEPLTYTDAGTYTVFYKVTKDNFTDVTGSATVTINKAAGSINYATGTVKKTYGEEAFTNKLTITGDGTVTYASNKESVATVDANGMVTIVGDGEATITATVTDGTNYTYATKTATYQLIVTKPQDQGYNLWIGDTQVTKDNQDDVFGDAEYDENGELSKAGSYIFNSTDNILLITDNQRSIDLNDPNAKEVLLTIKTCLPNLKIYLNEENVSKVKSIVFDNQGDNSNEGSLTFTCFNQKPGTLVIQNDEGLSAISGFKSIDYEYSLIIREPEGAYLANNELYKAEDDAGNPQYVPANIVTVGPPILPCDKIIPLDISNVIAKDAHGDPLYDGDGNPQLIDLTNGVVDGKVLVTAQESNNSDSDEGYDDSDGTPGIAFVGTMTDDAVVAIADAVKNNDVTPGGQRFAEYYNGITINLPEGEGLITAIIEAEPGYTWHLSIDGEDFVCLIEGDAKIENYHVESYNEDGYPMVRVDISYHVNRPTYCYLYLVKDNAGVRGIAPIGKRDKAHGKIVTVGVKVVKSAGKNPPSEASGGVIPEETDIVTGITDNSIIDNHIRVDNDRWYNLNGQQVDKPTKQGLYIHKGKKVFLQ